MFKFLDTNLNIETGKIEEEVVSEFISKNPSKNTKSGKISID